MVARYHSLYFCNGYLKQSGGVLAKAIAPLFALAWSIVCPNTIEPFYLGIILSGGILVLAAIGSGIITGATVKAAGAFPCRIFLKKLKESNMNVKMGYKWKYK